MKLNVSKFTPFSSYPFLLRKVLYYQNISLIYYIVSSRLSGSFSFIIITQSKLSIPSHTLCIVWCEFDMCELFKIPYFNFNPNNGYLFPISGGSSVYIVILFIIRNIYNVMCTDQ